MNPKKANKIHTKFWKDFEKLILENPTNYE